MRDAANKPVERKRGRKSSDEISHQVVEALKNLQELERLENSPLVQLRAVRQLAETNFRSSLFPGAFALRSMLLETTNALIDDLAEIPGYQRELRFLQLVIQGQTVTEISRGLGLSREHVARTVQPRAMRLMAKMFVSRANAGHTNERIEKGR
jgi:DNA-binding NarL/FixJ family response regulator